MKIKSVGQIFLCETCGNEVIVTKKGKGELKCCDKPMKLVESPEFGLSDEENEEAEE